MAKIARWYNRQLFRMNLPRSSKFIFNVNKKLKSTKATLEKAEKLQSKGKNRKALKMLQKGMGQILDTAEVLAKGPKRFKKIKALPVKKRFKKISTNYIRRLKQKEIILRCKSTVSLLTKG